jgi:hypothetical protein
MALERAYLGALESATMVFIAGDEMELQSSDGVVLEFRRLEQGG